MLPHPAAALDRLNISAAQSQGSLAAMLAPLRRLAAVVEELTLGAESEVQSEPLPVSMIAPMHGPVVKQALTELVGRCARWGQDLNGWAAGRGGVCLQAFRMLLGDGALSGGAQSCAQPRCWCAGMPTGLQRRCRRPSPAAWRCCMPGGRQAPVAGRSRAGGLPLSFALPGPTCVAAASGIHVLQHICHSIMTTAVPPTTCPAVPMATPPPSHKQSATASPRREVGAIQGPCSSRGCAIRSREASLPAALHPACPARLCPVGLNHPCSSPAIRSGRGDPQPGAGGAGRAGARSGPLPGLCARVSQRRQAVNCCAVVA